jgi:hypothetical protein
MKPAHAHKQWLCGRLTDLHSVLENGHSWREKIRKIPIDTQPRNLYSLPSARDATQPHMTSPSPQIPSPSSRRTPSFFDPMNFQKQKNFLIDA